MHRSTITKIFERKHETKWAKHFQQISWVNVVHVRCVVVQLCASLIVTCDWWSLNWPMLRISNRLTPGGDASAADWSRLTNTHQSYCYRHTPTTLHTNNACLLCSNNSLTCQVLSINSLIWHKFLTTKDDDIVMSSVNHIISKIFVDDEIYSKCISQRWWWQQKTNICKCDKNLTGHKHLTESTTYEITVWILYATGTGIN